MKYNFDEKINRYGTNSAKWDNVKAMFGRADVLPMWVADMDLRCPYEVIDALKERLEHPIFGYTTPNAELYDVIVERMKKLYNWDIKKEWIAFTPGVVDGLNTALRSITVPADEVVVQPPVYYPFFRVTTVNGCKILENPLKREGNKYYMDFAHLESLYKTKTGFGGRVPRIRSLILCNPHNPVGRVWTKEELLKLGEICLKNKTVIISDEIHSDLLFDNNKMVPIASLSPELEQNTITFIAPSKTFNVAGLKASVVIIPNDDLRARFAFAQMGHSGAGMLGLIAMEAAYKYGDDYLTELRAYLQGNLDYFMEYVEKNIPELTCIRPEGTYLLWLDMSKLGLNKDELADFMINKARVATDFGYVFGTGGELFERVNLACTRDTIKECLKRLENAVKELR